MSTTTHVYPARGFTSAASGSLGISRSWPAPRPAAAGRCAQLANDLASSAPVSARITPTATAEGLTCTDIGTPAVWLATTVVTGRPGRGIRVPVGVATLPESLGLDGDAVRAWQGEWPNLEEIRDPGELDRVQAEYNSVRLHAMGYLTRTTNTKAEAKRSAGPAATGSPRRGWTASHTVETQSLREDPVAANRPWLGIRAAS
jgi:hypothetical protein